MAATRELTLVLSRREALAVLAGALVAGLLLFLAGMGAGASAGCGAPADGVSAVAGRGAGR